MRIYLTGQNNFGNRGCEALVRSTIQVIREALGEVEFLVPALDAERDLRQWPDAAASGVRFVSSPPLPGIFLQWSRVCSRMPFLTHLPWPGYKPDAALLRDLESCDVLLSIGGDSYSLDYDLASLFFFAAVGDLGLRLGKPVILWGASVGPFTALPGVEKQLLAHLRRFAALTVRESHSINYLREAGVTDNVVAVVDSAFAMTPQPVDVAHFWPEAGTAGVLALNLSPVVESLRARAGEGGLLLREAVRFVRSVVEERGMSVLLVPHVDPLDGSSRNSDTATMSRILADVSDLGERVRIVPPGMNAPQLKYIISRCRFLIAARTHATIAAFSTGVPTISIAYSVKAQGINRDLFGHERYVLDTRLVSADTLSASLSLLEREEGDIKTLLKQRIPEWRSRTNICVSTLKNCCPDINSLMTSDC
ncbi:MAG: polysaccharide pyruvyl transferase family protein [Rhodocyclaceae bacterium]|nr:polysaccharide pyruvyl transferase family protein [Rhodocyclaceae bacterium]